jgi:hypothetical protein
MLQSQMFIKISTSQEEKLDPYIKLKVFAKDAKG